MVITKEEKKKEILDYLDKETKRGNWTSLTKKAITEKFVNEEFDWEDIDNIIVSLNKDKRITKSTINFDIRYPKIYKKKIKKELKHYVVAPKFLFTFLGFYVIVALATLPSFYTWLKSNFGADTVDDFFVFGILLGLVGSHVIGGVIEKLYIFAEDKVPLIQKNREVIYPMIWIAGGLFGIVTLFSIFTNNKIETGHVISILTVAVLGGLGYITYIRKTAKSEE